MEQVSTPTAVECGSTDREPSGKFTEQPKLPVRGNTHKREWQTGKPKQHSAVTGTGYCVRMATSHGRYQASLGAVAPPRSCRFLLMREPCGLSIGMTDGDVCPTLSKAAWSSMLVEDLRAHSESLALTLWWPLAPMKGLWAFVPRTLVVVLNHRSRSPRQDAASQRTKCS